MSNRAQLILILAPVVGALAFVGFQVFRATGTRSYAPDATFTERARLAELVRVGGPLFADLAPQSHRVKELGATVDIYPDGPVSLRLPIEFVPAATNIAARVAVSYMACKTDGLCLRPVERQVLGVQIASSQLSPDIKSVQRTGTSRFAQ